MLASFVSGLVSRVACHPLDTVKSIIQQPVSLSSSSSPSSSSPSSSMPRPSPSFTSVLSALRAPVSPSSAASPPLILRLYAGLPAALVGGLPGTVLYLSTYEATKNFLSSNSSSSLSSSLPPLPPSLQHFVSGLVAEAVACVVYVPVDVVKERMQVQEYSLLSSSSSSSAPFSPYRNSGDALRQIVKTEGLSGIYRGYWATLLSFGPFSALYFLLYEDAKARVSQSYYNGDSSSLPFPALVSLSAVSAGLASFLTSPLDLGKLRLQVYRRGGLSSSSSNLSLYQCLSDAYRHEGGIRALWKGGGMRVAFFAPATAISMGLYDWCKGQIANRRS